MPRTKKSWLKWLSFIYAVLLNIYISMLFQLSQEFVQHLLKSKVLLQVLLFHFFFRKIKTIISFHFSHGVSRCIFPLYSHTPMNLVDLAHLCHPDDMLVDRWWRWLVKCRTLIHTKLAYSCLCCCILESCTLTSPKGTLSTVPVFCDIICIVCTVSQLCTVCLLWFFWLVKQLSPNYSKHLNLWRKLQMQY